MRLTPEIVEAAEKQVKKSPRGTALTLEAEKVVEPPKPVGPPCVLDTLPIGSKLVVVRGEGKREAVIVTPNGPVEVPPHDLARSVPEGAKIVKQAEDRYVAEVIGVGLGKPALVTTSARDALERFNSYFG